MVDVRVKRKEGRSLVIADLENGRKPALTSRDFLRTQIRRMLCLDEDLSDFHSFCAKDPVLRFVNIDKCGGMLRSPTAFEDLIKTVCTTNCDWRNTTKMCEGLCSLNDGQFPTPEVVLRHSGRKLARKASLGYRVRTVRTIARLTLEGELPLDEWAMAGHYDAVRQALRAIWGVGPYVVNHMLVLLGCYEDIPVDSGVLKYLRKTHFSRKAVSSAEAVKPYDRYGKYKFLAYKFGRMARRMNNK